MLKVWILHLSFSNPLDSAAGEPCNSVSNMDTFWNLVIQANLWVPPQKYPTCILRSPGGKYTGFNLRNRPRKLQSHFP